MQKNEIVVNIVFASDDYFSILLGVALCSIFENKKSDYQIRVFVIDGGIQEKNRLRLSELEKKYNFSINYIFPKNELFVGLPINIFPVAAYYRIIIGRLLPDNISRTIYFDCDILVCGDVKELFEQDLDGMTIGAVRDVFFAEDYNEWLGIRKNARYFNSGVLLIDLDLWRRNNMEDKLFDFMKKNPEKLRFADQDALNFIFANSDYKELDIKYNTYPSAKDLIKNGDPFIVHFAGSEKPWCRFSLLPFRNDYFNYLEKTPWKKEKYRRLMGPSFAKKYYIYKCLKFFWKIIKKIKARNKKTKFSV